VSRFLPDDLFVGVEKGRLSFVRRRRGFNSGFVAAFSLPLPNDFWENPDIDLISRTLPTEVCVGTQASVVIADRLVRYFLVERPQGARSAQEIEQMAALRFEELYSEDARTWQIQIDLPPWAPNFLACGMQETHLALLHQFFASLHIPVKRISPFGIEQWNRHGRTLRAPNTCFLALSSDTVWLAIRQGQRWLSAYVHGLRNDTAKELPELIHRELIRHDLQNLLGSQTTYVSGVIDKEISSTLASAHILSDVTWSGADHLHTDSYQLALSSVWPVCK